MLCTLGASACGGDDGANTSQFASLGEAGFESGDGDSDTGDSGDGDGDPGDGDGDPGDGDGDSDPCADVDCSGHGDCVVVAGEATCACDPGYLPDALECIACPFVDPQDLDFVIPSVSVNGEATITGVPHNDYDHDAVIYLVDTVTQDRFFLADTVGASYTTHVIPGIYDVYYDRDSDFGDFPVPANNNAKLMTGVDLTQSTSLDIVVNGVSVSGEASITGVPHNDYDHDAVIYLVDTVTQDRFFLADTVGASYTTHVIPGIYDVYYDRDSDFGDFPVPANNNAALMCVQIR
ncbi:Alkaline phosphatase [Enhygromyxa salina]|uniref:Alkaline phosphatase n=1 Tax=Enhygromyxa salina TaxID=215803 RepID=A0A0C2CU00_9BACT|nr:calcium-binding EGF-like domain-containing protein [Enhygromyxa salina]KIG13090.1 Alkaline phosphatase [Enhygromyxa salina]